MSNAIIITDAMRQAAQAAAAAEGVHVSDYLVGIILGAGLSAKDQAPGPLLFRPSGRMCTECRHLLSDCEGLPFATMQPIGKPDPGGTQRVKCTKYVKAA